MDNYFFASLFIASRPASQPFSFARCFLASDILIFYAGQTAIHGSGLRRLIFFLKQFLKPRRVDLTGSLYVHVV